MSTSKDLKHACKGKKDNALKKQVQMGIHINVTSNK